MQTINRIPSLNGTVNHDQIPVIEETPVQPTVKPKRKSSPRKPKAKTVEATPVPAVVQVPAKHNDHLGNYAIAGVVVMSVLSAGLNGYANSLNATVQWAGWIMGIAIPAIILLLGKVAGICYQRGAKKLAYLTAASGMGLLFLSIYHCAMSICLLTGGCLALAIPMAIAIDLGFVACELALLISEQD